MAPDPQLLFAPLMVASIAGAGLTLAGGDFIISYVKNRLEDQFERPIGGLLSISSLLSPIMKLTMIIVVLFLISALLLIFYAFAEWTVYASYGVFIVAIISLFYFIIYRLIFFNVVFIGKG